jgi:hypothetical protein
MIWDWGFGIGDLEISGSYARAQEYDFKPHGSHWSLQSHISNLTSPISHLQSHISNLTSPISHLQSHISNLTSPIADLKSLIRNPTLYGTSGGWRSQTSWRRGRGCRISSDARTSHSIPHSYTSLPGHGSWQPRWVDCHSTNNFAPCDAARDDYHGGTLLVQSASSRGARDSLSSHVFSGGKACL